MTSPPVALKLVAGLGNPGAKHAETRHNAGFWFLDRLAARHRLTFAADPRLFGEQARLQYDDLDIRLFKPATYMNDSGRALQAIMNYYRLAPTELLVVHDEIDLEPGTIRLKLGGGHAGHNGVRDIIDCIGSHDFNRLRIGVGHPGEKERVVGAVLGRPTAAEKKIIDSAIDTALELLPLIMTGEFNKAMNQLHRSDKSQAISNKIDPED